MAGSVLVCSKTIAAVVATAVLLATGVASAQAAPGAKPWASRHGLTSKQYQQEFEAQVKAKRRLISVSGYMDGGKVRYAALWRKVSGPKWRARHGLTSGKYQKAFDAYAKKGYRLVYVDGYETGSGHPRYAAIWEKRGGPKLKARHGLTHAKYQKLFDTLTDNGYRLLHVSGYTRKGKARYAAIFEKSSGPKWVSHHRMTSSSYQKAYKKYGKKGYRLAQVGGYRAWGKDRYAAIWQKKGGPPMRARHGIALGSYQRVSANDRLEGYYPVHIDAFTSSATPKFATIGHSLFSRSDLKAIRKAFNDFLDATGVAGLSAAIGKDGKVLFASGFGWADREDKVRMDALHRLRIGSVSKPVTSVAIHKLVDEGKLSSTAQRVFGPGGVLSDVKVPRSMAALEDATIADFLEHKSGLPGASSGRGLWDPVNCAEGDLSRRIEYEMGEHVKRSRQMAVHPLLGAPGEFRDYSNFGYAIGERIVEVASGMTYEDYVRSNVLGPNGITDARLFEVGPYDPSWGEAKHYDRDGNFAEFAEANTCEKEPPGAGAGGWGMSAYDELRFLIGVDGRPQRDVLAPATWTSMVTPMAPTSNPSDLGYAKGWIVNWWGWCGDGQTITLGHNGGLHGGTSDLFELSNGYSAAVTINQNTAEGVCERDSFNAALGLLDTVDWPQHDLFVP